MYLNADIPTTEVLLRKEFLYRGEAHQGEYVECIAFGVASIPGRCVMLHLLSCEGACFWRIPLHAVCWRECAPMELSLLELWDGFSYHVSVWEGFLSGLQCKTRLRDGSWHAGTCLFTLDWAESSLAENAGDAGHKCGHFLKLDSGHFAVQPNNRILWREPSFVTRPFKQRPDYKTIQETWSAEAGGWQTRDEEAYFYEVDNGASVHSGRADQGDPRRSEDRR